MQHRSYNASMPLPVYVFHHPALRERRALLEPQLSRIGASDVTWVLCANGHDALATLDADQVSCVVQMWRLYHMGNGTISLAIKHLLAYRDMRLRAIPAALCLEDDADLPDDLWPRTLRMLRALPPLWHILWLGGRDATQLHVYSTPFNRELYFRKLSVQPLFLGAHAYVFSSCAAEAFLGWPVRGPADFAISHIQLTCWNRTGVGQGCHIGKQYGPGYFIVHSHRNQSVRTHMRSDLRVR